ncbi:hypothetical protein [Ferribacterium limneticum]|uniref:hypothetical protein n=1 Tax=Ferribacterium limneticum TaxID=76259 RepID=UPI001CF83016|nr:hypothetical protein [Ferribacterium limneticum]UCV23651.1 hypothetical protein KI613_03685 [Ferribacterium limneticum]
MGVTLGEAGHALFKIWCSANATEKFLSEAGREREAFGIKNQAFIPTMIEPGVRDNC